MMNIKPQLDELGVNLVAVGNGNKMFATKFIQGLPFTGRVYLDPESSVYKVLNLPRWSPGQILKRFFFSLVSITWFSSFQSKYKASDMEGDGNQSGAVFVLGPGPKLNISYSFKESEHDVSEFADPEAILKACRS